MKAALGAAVALILLAQGATLPRRYGERAAIKVGIDDGLTALVSDLSPPGTPVLVLGDAQRLGYRLGRPTLAVPAAFFTAMTWDETRLREVSRHYGARLFIVAREPGPSAARTAAEALSAGRIPAWLVAAGETRTTRVYLIR